MYAVVGNAGRAAFPAGMFTTVSAFHHLWGRARAFIFVEQPIASTAF